MKRQKKIETVAVILFFSALALAITLAAIGCEEKQTIEIEECHSTIALMCKKAFFCYKIEEHTCIKYLLDKGMCEFDSLSQYERFRRCSRQVSSMTCVEIRHAADKTSYSVCEEFMKKGGL